MSASLPTGLLVLHGNRAELLAETVAGWLARQPLSPLEDEIVLVQSNGMAEWLKMTLAGAMGVCAASRVELPARFQWWLYRQVMGREGVPRDSPLDKAALTWRLVRLLPDLAQQPGFAPVAGFLHDDDPERLLQLAQRLADLLQTTLTLIEHTLDDVPQAQWQQELDEAGQRILVQAARLDEILGDIERTSAALIGLQGKTGQHIRENEWLMSIRGRTIMPGGACEFVTPDEAMAACMFSCCFLKCSGACSLSQRPAACFTCSS